MAASTRALLSLNLTRDAGRPADLSMRLARLGAIQRVEYKAVPEPSVSGHELDPFDAIRPEHRATRVNLSLDAGEPPVLVRRPPEGEKYHGPQGRLVVIKKR